MRPRRGEHEAAGEASAAEAASTGEVALAEGAGSIAAEAGLAASTAAGVDPLVTEGQLPTRLYWSEESFPTGGLTAGGLETARRNRRSRVSCRTIVMEKGRKEIL